MGYTYDSQGQTLPSRLEPCLVGSRFVEASRR